MVLAPDNQHALGPPKTMPTNRAEAFVQHLCKSTFLSLFSVANPMAAPGKELCDVLVVCAPDVIIFSVKDIALDDHESANHLTRWKKKAIDASARQLYGAQRTLARITEVAVPGKAYAFPLPEEPRSYHRVAVALGAKGFAPISEGDLGKGFVHVFEETALEVVLGELDTVTDFITYLRRKEALLEHTQVLVSGAEQEMLGLYLQHGRKFPTDHDLLVISEGIWDEVTHKPEWARRKEEDQVSYIWDRLINMLHEDFQAGVLVTGQALEVVEQVTRIMAREDRFARRILAKSYVDFMNQATSGGPRARINRSPSGVVYVYLATSRTFDRDARRAELGARCFVARGLNPDCTTVVGIATERFESGQPHSVDVAGLVKTEWTDTDSAEMARLQKDVGIFREVRTSRASEHEFPDAQ